MKKVKLFTLNEIEEESEMYVADESFNRVVKVMEKHRELFERIPVYLLLHTSYAGDDYTLQVQLLGKYKEEGLVVKGNPYYEFENSIAVEFTENDLPDFHWLSPTIKEEHPPGHYPELLCIEPSMDTIYELYIDKSYVDNQFMKFCLTKEVDE